MFALATVPVVVMLVCGLVLVVSSVWRLRSRRAGGTGVIPMAFLWSTLGALVLSAGAVAVRGVLPDGTAPTAAPSPTVQLGANAARFSSSLSGGEAPSGAVSAPASIVGAVSPSSVPSLSQAGLTPQTPPAATAPGAPLAAAPYGPLAGGGAAGAATGGTGASGTGAPAGGTPANTGGTTSSPHAPLPASSPAPAPVASATGSASTSPSSSASPAPAASPSASPTAPPSKRCGTDILGVTVSLQDCK
ncbi:hypothetical protein [Sinomonas terrae]|uniref:Uncharacterized protein n=1 Tax=Sinomonas terrae TaxID=2908838 RepID=A0ABS9U450_9MICC|nr:hypothetical protein [Sinomonas terrae]MCH6471464.1 hypothetical protein [Sinomonas terrae]